MKHRNSTSKYLKEVTNSKNLAAKVFRKMFGNDSFSKRMGMKCLKIEKGSCVLSMKVKKEMLNGFDIAHGSIAYSLADSALAFASNSHGKKSVSIETSISHIIPLKAGDVITAAAKEISRSNKIGVYHITITNRAGKKVALFKGTVYRTSKNWF